MLISRRTDALRREMQAHTAAGKTILKVDFGIAAGLGNEQVEDGIGEDHGAREYAGREIAGERWLNLGGGDCGRVYGPCRIRSVGEFDRVSGDE